MALIGTAYDVTVIDNESTDSTSQLAVEKGARVINVPGNSISKMRNVGARSTDGEVLIFLDGDMELSETWATVFFSETLPLLLANPFTLTGSTYKVPESGGWIEKEWYKPTENRNAMSIPGGHMITTRYAFNKVNGFDETLTTNEDTDFSRRIKVNNGNVVHNINLSAYHHGYAKTITAFFKRFLWASRKSLLFNKKIMVASIINVLLLLVLLWERNVESIVLYSLFIFLFSATLSWQRSKKITIPGLVLSATSLYAFTTSLINLFSINKLTMKGSRAR